MAGTAGKKALLKVSTDDITYTTVAGLDSISMSIDGQNVDDSEFGVDWTQRLQGIKDFKLSASGKVRLADTNGQLAIRAALINDTTLYAKFLPDGGVTTNGGFKCLVKPMSWKVDPTVQDKQGVSFDLEGNGAPTAVTT